MLMLITHIRQRWQNSHEKWIHKSFLDLDLIAATKNKKKNDNIEYRENPK